MKTISPCRVWANPLLLIVATSTLCACGDHHSPKSSSQVAAKVGSYEITIYQLNNAISHLPVVPPEELAAQRSSALDVLVNQQLAFARAQDLKLDRTPAVVASVEEARRGIIAQAYINRTVEGLARPSQEEIHKYYEDHPELFAARKLYSLKEITAPSSPKLDSYSGDFTSSGKPIEQLGQWMKDAGIQFHSAAETRGPESLPLNLLPQLSAAKPGAIVRIDVGTNLYVAQVVDERPAAVSESQAAPRIASFLQAQRSRDLIKQELSHLRDQTKIEYLGEFANSKSKGLEASPEIVLDPAAPNEAKSSTTP